MIPMRTALETEFICRVNQSFENGVSKFASNTKIHISKKEIETPKPLQP